MKKKVLNILILSAFIVTACSKSFLEKSPTDVISEKDLANAVDKDPSLLGGNISGLYALMFQPETGGTTGDDDFGQKAQDINMDLLSTDMVMEGNNYGWFVAISRFQPTVDFTSNGGYIPWRYYYRVIMSANSVIDALGGNDADLTTDDAKFIMGQAKAMRAYCYFYLAQLYGKEGYGTGNEPLIPIYKSLTDADMPLSTSKDVYDFIVEDLKAAISDLENFSRTSKSQVNKYVAKGLLSYALMARGTQADWQEVVTLTNDIINNSGHPLTTKSETAAIMNGSVVTNPESGFNNLATPSWMWGTDLTAESGVALDSWWGHMDYYTYSYASSGDAKIISQELYDAIPTDDIRKKQFHPTALLPIYKLFDPARVWDGQLPVTTDLLYMRVDEFYLLNAEANANLGQDGAAKSTLEKLVKIRKDNISYLSSLTGSNLKEEIYFQTRVELWGEGKVYLYNKRNKKTVTVPSNHLFNAGEVIPFNSQKLTFSIPQNEILNNPNIN